MKISETKVLEIIAAPQHAAFCLLLAYLSDEEVRELHALMYVGRDGMTLEDARLLDRTEPRDVLESTIVEKAPARSYLRAGLTRARGTLA